MTVNLNCLKIDYDGGQLEQLAHKNGFANSWDFTLSLSHSITVEIHQDIGGVTYVDVYKDGEYKESYSYKEVA